MPIQTSPVILPRRAVRAALALILLATAAAFFPTLSHDFTNWDDRAYVIDNPLIRNLSPGSIARIFTTPHLIGQYHPLTLLSYAVDYAIGGTQPFVYHLTNLILHGINILLAAWLIRSLTKNDIVALIAAALFALHPLHVEPVVWIASRKDVLYSVFFLAGLVRYVILREARKGPDLLLFVLFVLACLSKSMAVTFPFLLLLIERHIAGPFKPKAIIPLIPFFVIAAAVGVLSIVTQRAGGALHISSGFDLLYGLQAAGYGIGLYFFKAAVPVSFSAFYPYPTPADGIEFTIFPYSFLLIALIGLGAFLLRRRFRFIVPGLLFFLLTIAPVLQIVPFGGAVAADRFAYVPVLGIFLVLGEFADTLRRRWRLPQGILISAATIVLIVLAVISARRSVVWENGVTLWSDVIQHSPRAALAWYNRGEAYEAAGHPERALADYAESLRLDPNQPKALNNRGNIFLALGKTEEALREYSAAITADPRMLSAHLNRGILLLAARRPQEAIADLTTVLQLDEMHPAARIIRGRAWRALKEYALARADAEASIERNLSAADGYLLLGQIAYDERKAGEAAAAFTETLLRRPMDQEALVLRAYAFAAEGKADQAQKDIRAAEAQGYRFDPAFLQAIAGKK